jgi:hypothetical protein
MEGIGVVEVTRRNDLIGWNAWGYTPARLHPIKEESHANKVLFEYSVQKKGGQR